MTPSNDRPEYVTCILKVGTKERESVCGRHLGFEFAFVSVAHAEAAETSGSRLVLCEDCRQSLDEKRKLSGCSCAEGDFRFCHGEKERLQKEVDRLKAHKCVDEQVREFFGGCKAHSIPDCRTCKDVNDWCSNCGTVLATKEGRSFPSCDSCS